MKKTCITWMTLCFLGVVAAAEKPEPPADSGQVLNREIQTALADIQHETDSLVKLRAGNEEERRPLARKMELLRKQVAELRKDADRIRQMRREGEKEHAARVADVEAREAEFLHLRGMISEYARSAGIQAPAAEEIRISGNLMDLRTRLLAEDRVKGIADLLDQLVDQTVRWNLDRLGGNVFEGMALDAEGKEHEGSFVSFGPAVYFISGQGDVAGMAVDQIGTPLPVIRSFGKEPPGNELQQVLQGEEVLLPVDVTGGDALQIEQTRVGVLEHIRQGGVVMIPLLVLGGLALVLAVWKIFDLHGMRVSSGGDVRQILEWFRSGRREEAEQQASLLPAPLGPLVLEALTHAELPRENLEEILHEHILGGLPRMERHLGTLAVLGGVAPLLGLLGTVTGMIHTFQLVTVFGSGDAKLLSGGISEALVTTEFGLAIAIPVLLVHAFLVRRAKQQIATLEQGVMDLVNQLKSENSRG